MAMPFFGAHQGGLIYCLAPVLVVGLLIWTLIGAILLRVAVSLYNWMARGSELFNGVPKPASAKAVGITFVINLVNAVVSFGVVAFGAGRTNIPGVAVAAQLLFFPISLLIMAAMLAAMLPTTFGRAMLVALCYFLIVLLVLGVIVGVFALIFVGMAQH
jgi:hypothetical protein